MEPSVVDKIYAKQQTEHIYYNIRSLPLACWINSRSASLEKHFDFSPVQSREWDMFQSASAHNLLQYMTMLLITESHDIIAQISGKIETKIHNMETLATDKIPPKE